MSPADDVIALSDSKLCLFRDAGEFCDVVLKLTPNSNHVANDSSIVHFKAHKLILVGNVPFFYHLYANDQLEDVVQLPSFVEPLALSVILDYVYQQPLSPRLIHSKLICDSSANQPFAKVLESLSKISSFLGLDQLTERLNSWSLTGKNIAGGWETHLLVKREADVVKAEVDVVNGDLSLPTAQDVNGRIDGAVIKRDLNSLERVAFGSQVVVSMKRIDEEPEDVGATDADALGYDDDDDNAETVVNERLKVVKRRVRSRFFVADDDSDDDAWRPSRSKYTKKRRRVFSSTPRDVVVAKPRKKRDPNAVKKTPKEPKLDDGRRKVRSRDLTDASMSIRASSTLDGSLNGDDSGSLLDLTTSTSTLNPESGVLEVNGESLPADKQLPDPSPEANVTSNPNVKTLSSDDLKAIFKNPRDFQHVVKRRILAKVDRVEGDSTSWHHGVDHPEPFLGKIIPFGNASSKIWDPSDDGKRVHGEVRGQSYKHDLELKLEDGTVQNNLRIRRIDGKMRCPFCDFSTNQQSSYKIATHFLNDHGYVWIDIALVCNLCSFVTVTGKNLRDHLHRFHSVFQARIGRTLFLCRGCGKQFRFREGRLSHEKTCLAGKRKDRRKGRETWLEKLRKDEQTGNGDDEGEGDVKGATHVCSECGKSYKNPMSLENHMCREHGKKKRFYCTVEGCTFGTNSKDPIYDHMYSAHKINVGAKPVLECKHCDYSTVRMHSFKKHQSCHGPQEYNVKCIIEGCDKAFRDDKGLRNHYRNCHVDMSLNCRYCDGIFRTPQKLRAHEEIMHTKRVRNFKCAYCNHATVQRTNCRTHIKNSHRGLPITVINLEKIGVVPQPEPPISGRGADYRPESP